MNFISGQKEHNLIIQKGMYSFFLGQKEHKLGGDRDVRILGEFFFSPKATNFISGQKEHYF